MIKLNIACGNNVREGWVNLDKTTHEMYDSVKYIDFEEPNFLREYKDNSVDEVLLSHCLEHATNPTLVKEECYRVLKKGGILTIKVPIWHDSIGHLRSRHTSNYLRGLYFDIRKYGVTPNKGSPRGTDFELISFEKRRFFDFWFQFKVNAYLMFVRFSSWLDSFRYSEYKWKLRKK